MMKRITAIALSLVLLLASSVIAFAEDTITLSFDYSSVRLPAGTVVSLKVTSSAAGDNLRVLRSIADEEYALLQEIPAEANTTVQVSLEIGPNNIKVQSVSGDDVLSESEPIMIYGYKSDLVRRVWDVDFETNKVGTSKNGIQVMEADGTTVLKNSDQSTLSFSAGAVGGTITQENAPVDYESHGQAVLLHSVQDASDNNQAQINNFNFNTSANTIIMSADYLFEDYNTTKNIMNINYQNTDNSAKWFQSLNADVSGKLSFGNANMEYDLNTWYHVDQVLDFNDNKLYCRINDQPFGVQDISTLNVDHTNRFSCRLHCTNETKMWFDNFNITEVKLKEVSFEKLFEIYSNDTNSIYSGNKLLVSNTVENYPTADSVKYFVSKDNDSYVYDTTGECGGNTNVTCPYEQTYVKASLFNTEGEFLAESAPIILSSKYLSTETDWWNVDFENHSLIVSGAGVSVADSDGSPLVNENGEKLQAYTGSANSTMTLVEENGNHFIRLYAGNETDEVQFNEFSAATSGEILLAEIDYKCDVLANTTVPLRLFVSENESLYDSRYIPASMSVSKGNLTFGTASMPFKTGKWYNIKNYINFADNTIICYIDGKYFGTVKSTKNIYSCYKLSVSMKGTTGATAYYDNLRITKLFTKPEITSVNLQDANTMDVHLSGKCPNIFTKENCSVNFGNNRLNVNEAILSEDGQTLTLKTDKKIHTAVPLLITLKFNGEDSISGKYTLPPSDFDIENVSFQTSGGKIGVSASVKNGTAVAKTAIVFMILQDANEVVTKVSTKFVSVDANTTAPISITPVTAAYEKATVFFCDNWTNLMPLKSIVYEK